MDSFASRTPDGNTPMRSGFLPDRIIHLHPTLRCNLACAHCYSDSDPHQKAALDPAVLGRALAVLQAEGYAVISVSGGEPLVYRPLRAVVENAKAQGFRVTMISNGLLVKPRMDPLLSLLDGIAISFDGMTDTHNAVRGRPDAFDRASSAVRHLADSGMPAAAAVSLTRQAIPELPDLADHLVGLGARAIQVRPVARAGRALSMDHQMFYSAADRARLYLVVLALRQELPDTVRVHCDLAPAQGLWQQREVYAALLGECTAQAMEGRPLADLINPLIITERGVLKPIAYDFDARFDVALADGLKTEHFQRYKNTRLARLRALIGTALAGLQHSHELIDWFDSCARLSEAQTVGGHGPEPQALMSHQKHG